MTPETEDIPDWARRERQPDLAWIVENIHIFWPAATTAFEKQGRGAIVVDTTSRPAGEGNPFGYFPQEFFEQRDYEDTNRMVAQYDPETELVVMLLKSIDRTSTYRLRGVLPKPWEAMAGEAEVEAKPEPPNIETLMQWESEGGCEAACPHHCWIEPDGVCSHGNPSWLLKLGLI